MGKPDCKFGVLVLKSTVHTSCVLIFIPTTGSYLRENVIID